MVIEDTKALLSSAEMTNRAMALENETAEVARKRPDWGRHPERQRQADDTKLLSPLRVASMLGLSPVTIRLWIAQRKIAAVRVGDRLWRISEAEVKRLLDEGAQPRREKPADAAVF